MALLPLLSNPLVVSSLILTIFFLRYLLKLIIRGNKKLNLPPCPPKLPIIGNLHQLGTLPHHTLKALSDKYGPLMLLHIGQVPTLVISSAEMAKEMMKTHDIVFSNRPATTAARMLFYECIDLAFSPYGDYWKQVRKICVMELLAIKRLNLFQLLAEEEVALSIDMLKQACLAGTSVDISKMLIQISNNIVCRSLIGRRAEEDGNKGLAMLARKFMSRFTDFSFGDLFPYLRWMDVLTGLVARLKAISRELDGFLDEVMEEHKLSDNEVSEKKDLVHILLQLEKSGSLDIQLTQYNIKAILLDLFFAGTDTTATTMEWAMAELMRNKGIMKKAQEEIRRVVGEKPKIDMNDVSKMNYLKCIIKETLRLHPPGPLMPPRQTSTRIKFGGYDIPTKTTVLVNAFAIQTDPKFWKNPLVFLPERFETDPIDYIGHDFQFIPFGGGRRQCPGVNFGINSAEYIVANLLYWFDWSLPNGGGEQDLDMSEAYGLAIHKKVPLHLVPSLYSF